MKPKYLFIVFFLTTALISVSQNLKDDKGLKWTFKYEPWHSPIGLVYQNEFLFQIGHKVVFRKKMETITISVNAQFQKRNVTYVFPVILLNYFKPIKNKFGPVLNLEYSYRKIENITCNTLTPEIGIGLPYYFSINYGYNISLDHIYPWVSKNRVTLRLILPD